MPERNCAKSVQILEFRQNSNLFAFESLTILCCRDLSICKIFVFCFLFFVSSFCQCYKPEYSNIELGVDEISLEPSSNIRPRLFIKPGGNDPGPDGDGKWRFDGPIPGDGARRGGVARPKPESVSMHNFKKRISFRLFFLKIFVFVFCVKLCLFVKWNGKLADRDRNEKPKSNCK